jgi:sialate O-acetylesterase
MEDDRNREQERSGTRPPEAPWGAFLDSGAADWRIWQQGPEGTARLELAGRWAPKASMGLLGSAGGIVEARLVRVDTGAPLANAPGWRAMETSSAGTWNGVLENVSAGGLYRLETRFNPKGNKLGEWSLRGDTRQFLGVGDIWLIAGQSNASGYGRKAYREAPSLGVHAFRAKGEWGLAAHPLHDATDSRFPASREIYNNGHSPFLRFAAELQSSLGHPIGLVPGALGGSPLSEWHPENGPLFRNLAAMAEAAGGRVKGMVWYQGESDAAPGLSGDYLERFLTSAEGWRRALGQPDLPILTVQVGRYRSDRPGEEDREWSEVREAQRQAARRDGRIAVVPALDLPLDDTIHVGTDGNATLGARLAECALGFVHGRPAAWRAPDLAEASADGPDGIRLRFDHVESRLDSLAPSARPFRVADAEGVIPVEKAVYFHRHSVRLQLGRPLGTGAMISCGYGEDPDALPIDVERQMPALAFHAIPLA